MLGIKIKQIKTTASDRRGFVVQASLAEDGI